MDGTSLDKLDLRAVLARGRLDDREGGVSLIINRGIRGYSKC